MWEYVGICGNATCGNMWECNGNARNMWGKEYVGICGNAIRCGNVQFTIATLMLAP